MYVKRKLPKQGLISTQRLLAINSREHQQERDQLQQIRNELDQRKKRVQYETAYKDQVFKEVEIALQKQRADAEQQAQRALQQQGGQTCSVFSGAS